MKKKSKEITVFIVRRDTKCEECGKELPRRSFLRLEGEKALCLACADLDHLEFLPSGDTALTRRSRKNSKIDAVVVEWSRTRKRYERQGILAESSAIERAMQECANDAPIREERRRREEIRREGLDRKYVEEFASHIRRVYPNLPSYNEIRIAEHACLKYSGRVGRSSAAKSFDTQAIDLAVQAFARHNYTDYDKLLGEGWERLDAKRMVRGELDVVLERWR